MIPFLFLLAGKSAKTAMLLTTFIPGGGQFYTHRWVKGVIFGGVQSFVMYSAVKTQLELKDIEDEINQNSTDSLLSERKDILDRRREIAWWGALVWSLSILDAYVDAKLYNFNANVARNKFNEPQIQLSYEFYF